jgi:hypothetical protein
MIFDLFVFFLGTELLLGFINWWGKLRRSRSLDLMGA